MSEHSKWLTQTTMIATNLPICPSDCPRLVKRNSRQKNLHHLPHLDPHPRTHTLKRSTFSLPDQGTEGGNTHFGLTRPWRSVVSSQPAALRRRQKSHRLVGVTRQSWSRTPRSRISTVPVRGAVKMSQDARSRLDSAVSPASRFKRFDQFIWTI